MKIAVWNLPPVELLTAGFSSGTVGEHFNVQRLRVADCARVLFEGHVDAALLPTTTILDHHEDVDVVPAVAMSSWKFPFARIVLRTNLASAPDRLVYNPTYEQERFLAELILREHYQMEPTFVPMEDASPEDLLASHEDVVLLVGGNVPTMAVEGRVLDLGQEWFELANYPMTWGMFAARKDTLDVADIRSIRDAVLSSEEQRNVWLRARETSEALHAFYKDDFRFRLDDLCVAGLTELRQFLFYYDVVDDVRDIPYAFIPDDDEEIDEDNKPLL